MNDNPVKLVDKCTLAKLLNQRFTEIKSKETLTAILFIEFDDISRFNNLLGFNVDDHLMKKISRDIIYFLDDNDTLGKTNSQQLILVQSSSSVDSAEILAERIIHLLSEPCVIDDYMLYVHACIGISLYPIDGNNADDLIKLAENTTKYVAKENKGDIGFAKDYIVSLPSEKSLDIIADLPSAIENGDIYFLYQPQYSHLEKRFVGAELLSRWKHPKYGELSPELYIRIAEQSGMIGPLTIKALVDASNALNLLRVNGIDNFSLSINISPIFLISSSFNENIKFLVEEYDLGNGNLNFEITEEILLKHTDKLIKTLNKIKSFGINIEIDDFGTGYTSLQHLAYLPIDTLKIDKSFITDIDKDEKKKTLFKAIVDMGRALNINVIAEGVENHLQNNAIKAFDTITIQGYYYSEPLELDELIQKIKLQLTENQLN